MYLTKRKSAELAPFSPIVNHESCSREVNLVSYYQLTLFQFRQTFPCTPLTFLFIVHFFYLPIIIPFFIFGDVKYHVARRRENRMENYRLLKQKRKKKLQIESRNYFYLERILISLWKIVTNETILRKICSDSVFDDYLIAYRSRTNKK